MTSVFIDPWTESSLWASWISKKIVFVKHPGVHSQPDTLAIYVLDKIDFQYIKSIKVVILIKKVFVVHIRCWWFVKKTFSSLIIIHVCRVIHPESDTVRCDTKACYVTTQRHIKKTGNIGTKYTLTCVATKTLPFAKHHICKGSYTYYIIADRGLGRYAQMITILHRGGGFSRESRLGPPKVIM